MFSGFCVRELNTNQMDLNGFTVDRGKNQFNKCILTIYSLHESTEHIEIQTKIGHQMSSIKRGFRENFCMEI